MKPLLEAAFCLTDRERTLQQNIVKMDNEQQNNKIKNSNNNQWLLIASQVLKIYGRMVDALGD